MSNDSMSEKASVRIVHAATCPANPKGDCDCTPVYVNAAPQELPAVNSASREALTSGPKTADSPDGRPTGASSGKPDPLRDSAQQPDGAAPFRFDKEPSDALPQVPQQYLYRWTPGGMEAGRDVQNGWVPACVLSPENWTRIKERFTNTREDVLRAAELLRRYAATVRDCHSHELERFDYLPEIEDAAATVEALARSSTSFRQVGQVMHAMANDGKCGPYAWFESIGALPDGTPICVPQARSDAEQQ